jgi:hypothetical protein
MHLWPADVRYLTDYEWHPQLDSRIQSRYRNLHECPSLFREVTDALGDVAEHPSKAAGEVAEIRAVPASHPCHSAGNGRGLFARRELPPRTYLFDYLGALVDDDTLSAETAARGGRESDYVLHIHGDLNVDAYLQGNEARFINDYRGIAARPNVCFDTYLDPYSGMLRAGVYTVGKAVAAGAELLTSYGFANYWRLDGAGSMPREDVDREDWKTEWD